MRQWIQIALTREVVMTSLGVAAVVGTILVAINYGDRIVLGIITRTDIIKMILTYFVPYMVSTYASVKAITKRSSR